MSIALCDGNLPTEPHSNPVFVGILFGFGFLQFLQVHKIHHRFYMHKYTLHYSITQRKYTTLGYKTKTKERKTKRKASCIENNNNYNNNNNNN